MAFVNTRDTIGDQATVDGLVEHSLTELKEDGIGIVESYACYKNTGLQNVDLPNVMRIKDYAFQDCTNLTEIKIGSSGSSGVVSFNSNAFWNCYKLKHVIIDKNEMAVNNSGLDVFDRTQIGMRNGAIYVPNSIISNYKNNNKWQNYFILDIEQYPYQQFDDMITDDWNTILTDSDPSSKYEIGYTKTMTLTNGKKIVLRIAGFNTDTRSDNSEKAKITWACKYVYGFRKMNATDSTSGGWANCGMRSYLINDVLPLIPSEIKNHIVSVVKENGLEDDIWLMSSKEVGLPVTYSQTFPLFTGNTSRMLTTPPNLNDLIINESASITPSTEYFYWLRDYKNQWCYWSVTPGGHLLEGIGAQQTYSGIVFCFCTD